MTVPEPRATFNVGHWTDTAALTGCTVVLFDRLVPAIVDIRGGAPGTRETDLLAADRLVGQVDAILLTGGSAHGLVAADGVMQFLRETHRGYATTAGPVPIVSAAVIYDLSEGQPAWPTSAHGYAACQSAEPLSESGSGRVGAGTGATIRKAWPHHRNKPGGFGWSTVPLSNGVSVHAIAVVNAVGDVATTDDWFDDRSSLLTALVELDERSATTLVTVIVDGDTDHRSLRRIGVSAHDAMARTIIPCHTLWDGDLVYAVHTGVTHETSHSDAMALTIAGELAVERAIRSAVSPG